MVGIFSILRSVGSKIYGSYNNVDSDLREIEQRLEYGKASDQIDEYDIALYQCIVQQIFDAGIDPRSINIPDWMK